MMATTAHNDRRVDPTSQRCASLCEALWSSNILVRVRRSEIDRSIGGWMDGLIDWLID